MTHTLQREKGEQSPTWLATIPFIITSALLQPISVIFLNTDTLIIFLAFLITYTIAAYLAGPLSQQFWSGYLTLVTAATWLLLGLGPALMVVIIGAFANSLRFLIPKRYAALRHIDSSFSTDYLGRVSINGLGAISGYIIYVELGGQIPLMDNQVHPYISAFLVAMSGTFVLTQWLGRLFTNSRYPLLPDWRSLILEIVLWFVPPLIAHVYFRIGLSAFFIILGLVWFQFFRYYQVSRAQVNLLQRVRKLSTLNRVGQSISANLELGEVLQSIYREVSQIVKATTFLVVLYDEARELLDYRLVVRNGQTVVWPSRKLGHGITDSVIRDKKSLLVHKSDTERLRQLGINPTDVESSVYLGVPLMVSGKLIGVMGVYHDSDPRALSNEDVKVLQTIANQAALAIRNATLYDRTTRLANQLSLINQSVQNVLFNLDSDEAIRIACQTAMTITQAQQCALYFMDVDVPRRIRPRYISGMGAKEADYRALWQDHVRLGTTDPLIVSDTSTLSEALQAQANELGVGAYAIVPLRSGNTPIGYLTLYHNTPYYYQRPELDLLEMLANQVTAALDNAELLRALESYASEQAQLVHLSRMTTNSLELERVVSNTGEVLTQMVDVTHVYIGLMVPGRDYLRLYHTKPHESITVSELNPSIIPEFHQFSIEGAANPIPYIYQRDDDISPALRDFLAKEGLVTAIGLPMTVANDFFGLILLGHQEPRHFTDNERRLIEMAANQITAQLQNAQIYTLTEEALLQRLHHLSVIEDIAQQISRSLKLDIIIGNVLDASIRSTQADRALLALVDGGGYQVVESNANGKTSASAYIQAQERAVIAEVTRTREPIIIADNDPEKGLIGSYRSILGVPLIRDDRVIGVLNIESQKPYFFSEEQVSFIRSLAGHATISIQNARLLEEHEHQIQILTILRDMALEATQTANLGELATTLAKSALKMFSAKGSALFYTDEESGQILVRVSLGQYGQPSSIFVPDELIRAVMATRQTLFVPDIAQNPFYEGLEAVDHIGYQRLVALPLIINEYPTEVFCILFDDDHTLSDRDRLHGTVDLFAIQARALLENALLNERLRANNDRMRAILDSTRDGIILLDSDMRLLEANIAAERLLGINLNEHLGQNFARLLFDYTNTLDDNPNGMDEELRNMARILRTEPQRITQREYMLTNRVEPLYVKEVGAPVYDQNGRIIGRLLALHDITEDKAVELYRKKVSEMVYHDLRGPISTTISGLTFALDLINLMEDDSIDKKDLLALTDTSLVNARIVLKRVNTLLDIAKGDKLQPNLTLVSLSQLVTAVLLPKMSVFEEAQITLITDINSDLNVYVDAELIERVIDNLVDNALKYTPKGGQVLIVADSIPPQQAEWVRVRVCDTGPGIPPDKRDIVFKEFEQIENNRPERGGRGSGLGLAFCKLAIKAHGGVIAVEAEGPLSGACIAFTLPLPSKTTN